MRYRVNVAASLFAGAVLTGLTGGVANADPIFYGVTNNVSGSTLVRFDMGAHTVTTVGAASTLMEDCDFDAGGTLWAIRQGNAGGFPPTIVSQTFTIDLTTGAATQHGDYTSAGPTLASLAFRGGSFYSVNSAGGLTAGHLVTTDLNAATVASVAGVTQGSTPWRVDALA